MTTSFYKILSLMYSTDPTGPLDLDPWPQNSFLVTYSTPVGISTPNNVTVTIFNNIISSYLSYSDHTETIFTIDLSQFNGNLRTLGFQISTYPGFTAKALNPTLATSLSVSDVYLDWTDSSPMTLVDFVGQIFPGNPFCLQSYTSPLWEVLKPFSLAFDESLEDTLDSMQQVNILTASSTWLDYIVNLYGVYRQPQENDISLALRTRTLLGNPGLNSDAMAYILEILTGDTNINISFPELFTFSVLFSLNIDAIKQTVFNILDQIRAAGTSFSINLATSITPPVSMQIPHNTRKTLFRQRFPSLYGAVVYSDVPYGANGIVTYKEY